MTSTIRHSFALTALLTIATPLAGAEAAATTPLNLPVGGQGVLQLAFPSAWKAQVFGPMDTPTVRWTAAAGDDAADFLFGLTVMPSPGDQALSDEHLRDLVSQSGEPLLPTAEQTSLVLEPVDGETAHGYLFHLTDKKPESGPDDYREMYKGMVAVEPLVLSITLLTHSGDAATVASTRALIAGARFAPATSAPPGD